VTPPRAGLAGVVLAAGAGTRLRPLTDLRPKALCPVGGLPLLERALRAAEAFAGHGPEHVAVNAHHHADAVIRFCRGRATVSRELPRALGTAGALGALRPWIGGRDVLVVNADVYLPEGPEGLTDGWDGERSRLLCAPATGRVDFRHPVAGPVRYVGVCLLPWDAVRQLAPVPSGLYEVLWRAQHAEGALDLHLLPEGRTVLDCGTPSDYLRANLHASGGTSVVGEDAQVLGDLERCVVWEGAWVGPEEHLVECVRAGDRATPITVPAPLTDSTSPSRAKHTSPSPAERTSPDPERAAAAESTGPQGLRAVRAR